MDTLTPDRREEDWDAYQDAPETETDTPLPRRARRQFFNRRTAALGALVTCAIGFYAGIRVEKSQLSNSSAAAGSGASGSGARASAFAALAARGGASGAAAGAPGAAGGAGGGGAAGGANASFGTVAAVNGKTILVTDTSGNTVKVKVTPSTKITKNQSVSRHAIRPGDTVVVTGAGSGRTTHAASITDSGNRGASGSGSGGSGSASGSGSGSGSGGGGNSAVGSLFSSGG